MGEPANSVGGGLLRGRRILVLRPEGQADDLARLIAEKGGTAVTVPAIRILPPKTWAPIDDLIRRVEEFDWVLFTSANGVRTVFDRARKNAVKLEPRRVGAIGPATRSALESYGLPVAWMPSRFTTTAIAAELPGPQGRVALVRAQAADRELDEALKERGFEVFRVDAYRTEPASPGKLKKAVEVGVDAIAFTSASTVNAYLEAVGRDSRGATVCAIGPATATACRGAGLPVDVEAAESTGLGLAAAIVEYFNKDSKAWTTTERGR